MERKYLTETTKKHIGYNIPEAQYFIRFLKENKLLKKYINAFNQEASLSRRKIIALSYRQTPTSEQLYNPLNYICFVSNFLSSNPSISYSAPLLIVDQSINWVNTIEGFTFWADIQDFLLKNHKHINEQITRIEKNIKLKEHEIYLCGTKYWV